LITGPVLGSHKIDLYRRNAIVPTVRRACNKSELFVTQVKLGRTCTLTECEQILLTYSSSSDILFQLDKLRFTWSNWAPMCEYYRTTVLSLLHGSFRALWYIKIPV